MENWVKEMMVDGVLLIMLLIPVILVLMDIIFAVRKKKKFFFECLSFLTGFIYMALAYWIWSPPKYDERIDLIMDFASVHEPVSREHGLTVTVIAAVGLISYLVIKFARRHLSPLG